MAQGDNVAASSGSTWRRSRPRRGARLLRRAVVSTADELKQARPRADTFEPVKKEASAKYNVNNHDPHYARRFFELFHLPI